jgi:hypothetical protein
MDWSLGNNLIQVFQRSLAPRQGEGWARRRFRGRKAGSQLITAQRFSCVLGMLSSLGVQVPRPT